MSERINYHNIERNDPKYKDWGHQETAGHNDLHVDINRLIPLVERHPVVQKPLSELEAQLEYDCWIDNHGERTTPRAVIDLILAAGFESAKQNHPNLIQHIEKIEKADRSYPIFMYDNHVLNGMHRLAQVYIAKQTGGAQDFLTVKELKTIPSEAIISE